MHTNHCYIIAEAGLNHNGKMKIAKKLIDVAAVAEVDAVKFQKRNVATLATNDVLEAKDERFPSLGNTYKKIRQSLEFSKKQYVELKEYAEGKGLDFICTAFDKESVDFLEDIGLKTFKIASHSVTNLPLLEYIAGKRKSVIISTGMCTFEELDQAINIFSQNNVAPTILHCVSSYPQPVDASNLRLIQTIRERYRMPVGYSGHELGYLPSLIAVSLGAVMVERHFTLDKTMEGFDHKISLEPQELIMMTREIRQIAKMFGKDEKAVSKNEMITRKKYHVSMVASTFIPKGTPILEGMITYKNPGTGILPKDAHMIIGKIASVNIPEDIQIETSMVK